jgi:hypothetical protein
VIAAIDVRLEELDLETMDHREVRLGSALSL